MKALLDADILVYRVGFASKDESEQIALARLTETLTDIVYFEANCDTFDGFITGHNNYRKDIATILPYKGNRTAPKPPHYEAMRQHLVKMGCVEVEGQEADDAIGIAAYSSDPNEYIIVSIDKDLNMLRGTHYNFVKKQFYIVDEDEALKFFYTQLLTGDRTDNIQGIPGIGPRKAAKLLEGLATEAELYKACKEAYDDDKALLENARLLWIRREPNQLWSPPNA